MQHASELAAREQTVNMNAGPSPLPLPALLRATSALLSYERSPGMGVAEISHRSSAFQSTLDDANKDLRELLRVPENYKVLWMQGGGMTQFAATVLNMLAAHRLKYQTGPDEVVEADYVVTGSWSKKAVDEARRLGARVNVVCDGRDFSSDRKFRTVPAFEQWAQLPAEREGAGARKPAFVYYCDNETVDGVEFPADGELAFPFDKLDEDVPVVCDMSSNFLSRPVDVSKYGVIFAGAQKNLGPAGVSVVIVRDDLLGAWRQELPHICNSMLNIVLL